MVRRRILVEEISTLRRDGSQDLPLIMVEEIQLQVIVTLCDPPLRNGHWCHSTVTSQLVDDSET
jgi:hypothetical protein